MYKLNNISLSNYGILPAKVTGEGIALKGCFDLPKRIGDTHYAWADEDSVEPFVDADEIFLDARTIEFAGLISGSKTLAETNLMLFKELVAGFVGLVPFLTPYGLFSVQVKSMQADVKEGVTTLKIIFIEPQLGLEVEETEEEVTYFSLEYSETATKNNCESGYHGTDVILTSLAGAFTSILSQEAADQLAIDWVREQKQDYANVNGLCVVNPTIYYNTKQEGSLLKNNCGAGYNGSLVTYTVAAFSYSSLVSQVDADTKAQNEIAANLTQAYANENGSCSLQNLFYQSFNEVGVFNTAYGQSSIRLQKFYVASEFPVGTKFYVKIYSVDIVYVSILNDTRQTVIAAISALINAVTEEEWNEFNQAPVFGGNTKKPEAGETNPPIPNLFPQFFTPELYINLSTQSQATAWFETI